MILTFLLAQRHIIRAFTFASPKSSRGRTGSG